MNYVLLIVIFLQTVVIRSELLDQKKFDEIYERFRKGGQTAICFEPRKGFMNDAINPEVKKKKKKWWSLPIGRSI